MASGTAEYRHDRRRCKINSTGLHQRLIDPTAHRAPPAPIRTAPPLKPHCGRSPPKPRTAERPRTSAAERCDTRSHVLSEYVDWRFGVMPKT